MHDAVQRAQTKYSRVNSTNKVPGLSYRDRVGAQLDCNKEGHACARNTALGSFFSPKHNMFPGIRRVKGNNDSMPEANVKAVPDESTETPPSKVTEVMNHPVAKYAIANPNLVSTAALVIAIAGLGFLGIHVSKEMREVKRLLREQNKRNSKNKT